MSNPYYYIGANPTVDLIVLNHEGKILMAKREIKSPACPGMWALPGGFINTDAKVKELWTEGKESPKDAAKRELLEETNLLLNGDINILPVGIYEGNNRDPRDNSISWAKSYAFFYEISKDLYDEQKDNLVGLDDIALIDWKTLDEINDMTLAFDHKKIIQDGLNLYLKKTNRIKLK
jgi:ADP-ribose pyrophosphatase YjhB (NUDIX family)